MADEKLFEVKIRGIENLRAALASAPEKIRLRGVTKALRSAGKVIRDAARQTVPVLAASTPRRTRGLLKRRLSVRLSRNAKRTPGQLGIFVNVKPAAGARYRSGQIVRATQRGARSPLDPYYWRFVEFGTKKMRARPFMTTASGKLDQALAAFERDLAPEIRKLNRP